MHAPVPVTREFFRLVLLGDERRLALHGRVVALREVGGAAPQFGQRCGERVQHLAGRAAGRHPLRVRGEHGERIRPAVRQPALRHPLEQLLALRVGLRPFGEGFVPFGAPLLAALRHLPRVGDGLFFRGEVDLWVEAEDPLGRRHLFRAERGAVGLACVLLVRRGPADDRAERDQRRLALVCPGLEEGPVQGRHVLVIRRRGAVAVAEPFHSLHVPTVSRISGADILRFCDFGVVFDRDVIVVVEQRQVAELLVPGQGRHLVADALLDVAVGGEHVDLVVERAQPRAASGSNRPRSLRAAIAMPTALPMPWPSGPVVVSIPGAMPCSGCPGVRLPQVR